MSAPGTCTIQIAQPTVVTQQVGATALAGNLVRFLITITDAAGTPADTTTVTAQVGTNYADAVSLSVVHDSTGQYHADWDTTSALAETYYCDVAGTGTYQVAAELPITIKVGHL